MQLSGAARALGVGFLLSYSLQAQLLTRPSVEATGSATVSAPPDQAVIDATVSTTGTSAQDAAAKNATQTNGLLAALGKLLGSGANIRTTSYSVYPNYQNNPPGGTPTISGYTANSTVEVTLGDLTQAGPVIDTAVANGASSLGGISFSLKNPEPQRQQALTMATQQALSHANAMATGAGHTVGSIRSVQEGGTTVPVSPIVAGSAAGGSSTTVQPGLIQVTETVTVTADLN